jgi:hypothetical protein
MDRKTILLQAARDMLKKCIESPFVISPEETSVRYDDADCGGYCLLEDIENELESEESRISELERENAQLRECLEYNVKTDAFLHPEHRHVRARELLGLPNVQAQR